MAATTALAEIGADPALDEAINLALLGGDMSRLPAPAKRAYYFAVCKSLDLNPLTRPFTWMKNREGREFLYPNAGGAEQLRRIHEVDLDPDDVVVEIDGGILRTRMKASTPSGRRDTAMAALAIDGLKGQALADAYMKCETKCKRRLTFSITGLGLPEAPDDDDPQPAPEISYDPPLRRSDKLAAAPNESVQPIEQRIDERSSGDAGARSVRPEDPSPVPDVDGPRAPRSRPSTEAPDTSTAGQQSMTGLRIVDTQYVPKSGNAPEPFYEIKAKRGDQVVLFVTRSESLYKAAMAVEGSDHTVRVLWHLGKRADGDACKVLDYITVE